MKPLIPRSCWRQPVAPPPLSAFTPSARRLIARLSTPEQVQRWLNGLPYNWERRGDTARALQGVLRRGNVHCLEAAVCAAAILEHHGYPPLLLDLESVDRLDHVLFLFRRDGRYGTVARSRDPGLHGRKPVYRNLHTLVQSYAAPYVDCTGRLKGYGVLDLRTLKRGDWRTSRRNVPYIERALIENRHRRFKISDAYYRRWRRWYGEFKRRNPRGRPASYPNRRTWLWP